MPNPAARYSGGRSWKPPDAHSVKVRRLRRASSILSSSHSAEIRAARSMRPETRRRDACIVLFDHSLFPEHVDLNTVGKEAFASTP